MEHQTDENIIAGKNAVTEALRSTATTIDTVYITKEAKGLGKIIALAKQRGVVIKEVTEQRMAAFSGGKSRGVAALIASAEYYSVEDLLNHARSKGEEPFLIIADEIEDPHNLGAIIRTAEAAGAHGLIIPKRRSASLTTTVYTTSAGAVSWFKTARVSNISDTIKRLKEQNVWVYGAEADGVSSDEIDLSGAIALVIGSEGKGLGRLVRENCDQIISLPMHGKINSLNASVCAGILMYQVVSARKSKPL